MLVTRGSNTCCGLFRRENDSDRKEREKEKKRATARRHGKLIFSISAVQSFGPRIADFPSAVRDDTTTQDDGPLSVFAYQTRLRGLLCKDQRFPWARRNPACCAVLNRFPPFPRVFGLLLRTCFDRFPNALLSFLTKNFQRGTFAHLSTVGFGLESGLLSFCARLSSAFLCWSSSSSFSNHSNPNRYRPQDHAYTPQETRRSPQPDPGFVTQHALDKKTVPPKKKKKWRRRRSHIRRRRSIGWPSP